MFDPFNWYWKADDGRVCSSARSVIVNEFDQGFQSWLGDGNVATRWPVDNAGQQTEDSMQQVLSMYGLFASLRLYAASKRKEVEGAGFELNGIHYATDPVSQGKLVAAVVLAQLVPEQTFRWEQVDGTFTDEITAEQMIEIGKVVGSHVAEVFKKAAAIASQITAGEITTREEVDAAFAS